MLPIKFQDNQPFVSGEEAKNKFSRWRPSPISNQPILDIFLSTSHPDTSYQSSCQLAFSFRRRREKQIFKMVAPTAILDFGSKQF